MTGTQNHEGIAGLGAALEYVMDIGRRQNPQTNTPRDCFVAAFRAIKAYEEELTLVLLNGLAELPEIKVWGISDPARVTERVPTVAMTHRRFTSRELAEYLALRGIFAWHGNFYALPVTQALGLEPNGLLRISMVHYNTKEEVYRLLAALRELRD